LLKNSPRIVRSNAQRIAYRITVHQLAKFGTVNNTGSSWPLYYTTKSAY